MNFINAEGCWRTRVGDEIEVVGGTGDCGRVVEVLRTESCDSGEVSIYVH